MLKFIKHHMATIGGIEIFPLISFIIFFLFFIGLFMYVMSMRKESIDNLSSIPLEGDN